MRRRRLLVWLLSIPLMLAGSQLAHALAYWIVYPDARLRARDLVATGHGYMDWTPRVLGVAFAIEALVLVNLVVEGVRRRPARHLPAWLFAVLPAAGFSIQELLERILQTGTFPWSMVEQPTFRVGLLLQLPVGLLAYLLARLLLRTARLLGAILGGRAPARIGKQPACLLRPLPCVAPRLAVAGRGWGLRGPPLRPV